MVVGRSDKVVAIVAVVVVSGIPSTCIKVTIGGILLPIR
jgi:hypothetical protein